MGRTAHACSLTRPWRAAGSGSGQVIPSTALLERIAPGPARAVGGNADLPVFSVVRFIKIKYDGGAAAGFRSVR